MPAVDLLARDVLVREVRAGVRHCGMLLMQNRLVCQMSLNTRR